MSGSVISVFEFEGAKLIGCTVELGGKKLFGHPKIVPLTPNVSYPHEVNWQIGRGKWFLNTNLFLIKPFKFDNIFTQNSMW